MEDVYILREDQQASRRNNKGHRRNSSYYPKRYDLVSMKKFRKELYNLLGGTDEGI